MKSLVFSRNSAIPWTLVYLLGVLLALLLAAWAASEFMIGALSFDQVIISYPIAVQSASGTLTIAELFAWHNGHRYVPANLVTVLVSQLTDYNLWVEMVVMFAAAAAMIGVLYRLIARDFLSARWMIVPAAFLLLTLRGLFTWSYSFQIGFIFVLLFFFMSIDQARRAPNRWGSLFLCMLYSACASFTQGAGLVVWPLTWLTLLLSGASRWKLIVWIAVFIPFVLAFIQGFDGGTAGYGDLGLALQSPVTLIQYIMAYLANAFVPFIDVGVPPAIVLGVIGIALLLLNLYVLYRKFGFRRDFWERTSVPLSLIGFAVFSATVTGAGRMWFFTVVLVQPLTERYVIHAVPFWIGLGLLMTMNTGFANHSPLVRFIRLLNKSLAVVLVPAYVFAAYIQIVHIPPLMPQDGDECTVRYALFQDREDPCLRPLLPMDFENYLHVIDGQAERGWTIFASPLLETSVPQVLLSSGSFDVTLPSSYTTAFLQVGNLATEALDVTVIADDETAAEYQIEPGASADIDLSAWIGHTIRLAYSPQSAVDGIRAVVRLERE